MAPQKIMNTYSVTVNGENGEPDFELYTHHNWKNVDDLQSETFKIPSKKEIQNIKVDDRIKICNGIERFFVKVVNVEYTDDGEVDCMSAVITTDLVYEYPYTYGDMVFVYPNNIYSILKNDFIEQEVKKYKDSILSKNVDEINNMINILKNPTKIVDKFEN